MTEEDRNSLERRRDMGQSLSMISYRKGGDAPAR